MRSIHDIADEIVAREGGFVNDPDDPGGATKHGVTIGTLRRLGLDLDGDGDVDAVDVRAVGRDQARQIFLRDYFAKPGLDRLPESLQATVFDMQVNAGANAVKILQRLLGDMGHPVAVDGIIGPRTAAAAALAHAQAPHHLRDAYGIARRNYYYGLGDARPSLRKFARRRDGGKGGWITRAEHFVSPRYHLSDAEHRARVASWA
ncbi:Predicted Peptidoglycan domain-containing protein [Palleronia salina]|uniref:Predicted Peptidoglycan domain-containing protein n=1 Tax=Palleronia salina TaxID=313368 RepID=A0A1M6AAR2_9RHOB|nr:holin-associated N-acetylmuramidase [Palleronia salina]SHI33565.1 Predicted Peptidoglycan domain-containing protein [Palleronia salina]